MNNPVNIFLLQNSGDYRRFKSLMSKRDLVISFSPISCYDLERENVDYLNGEIFFDEKKAFTLGLENFAIAEKIVKEVEAQISFYSDEYSKIDRSKLIFTSFSYNVRNVLDYCYRFLSYTEGIINRYPDSTFHYSLYEPIEEINWYKFSFPRTTFYTIGFYFEKLPERIKRTTYYIKDYSEEGQDNNPFSIKKSLIEIRNNITFNRNGEYILAINIPKYFTDTLKQGDAKILTYNIEVNKMHYTKYIDKNASFENKKRTDIIMKQFEGKIFNFDRKLLRTFPLNDIAYKVLHRLINQIIRYLLSDLVYFYQEIECILSKKQISKALFISPRHPKLKLLVKVCKKHTIPTVNIQHGGAWGYLGQGLAEVFFSDLDEIDYFISFGKGVNDYVEKHANKYINSKVNAIPVGALILKKTQHPRNRSKSNVHKLRIMYIPTSYNLRKLMWHYYPENYYFLFQKRLIDFFYLRKPNVSLIYKDHYKGHNTNPMGNYISDLNTSRISIMNNKLSTIIHTADCFMTDSPTTTFLEICITDKPVICFVNTDFLGLNESALKLMRKRSDVFTDEKSFFQYLENVEKSILKSNIGKTTNTEFLELFGTHKNDGLVSSRFLNAINCIG